MSNNKLLHNQNCSKSWAVLKALKNINCDFEVIEYMKIKISQKDMLNIIMNLQGKLKELVRIEQKEYKELGIDYTTLNSIELANFFIQEPKILQRPIFIDKENKSIVVRGEDKLNSLILKLSQ